MSNAPTIALLALLALAAFAPTAGAQAATPGITNPAQSTPTSLYFHVGANQDFPINTQPPPQDAASRDDHFGLATESLSCLPQNDAYRGTTDHKWTTYYGFSSPGYVEYNFTNGDGTPRIHPERGLSFDVQLDPAVQPVVHWYITTFPVQPASSDQPHNVDPVIPNVVARATLRTGEKITLDDAGYNDGEIIAQGHTEPTTLAGLATSSIPGNDQHVTAEPGATPDVPTIYGFAIPLKYETTTIPKDKGFSIRIDLFMLPPAGAGCDDPSNGYIMPNNVATHTDPKHRPQMQLAVLNAVRIEYMHPQFVGDDLVIHTSENSPWGNYDVDETPGGINLEILKDGVRMDGVYRAAVVQRYHEHDHHTQAVDVTYVWPYLERHAQDGLYTINLEVKNDQGTATAKGIAQFEVGKGGIPGGFTECGALGANNGAQAVSSACIQKTQTLAPKTEGVLGSPSLTLVGLLGVLGVTAAVLRRRM
jgi:hypothetical protein